MSGSNIQYPPQTGRYAVKVKNGAGWRAFDVARFHISVGQDYHEGEKFAATMAWASHRFGKVVICVNDTLQRFNLEFDGIGPGEAFARSEAAGREWIERNIAALRQLPDVEIRRWEDWRQDPAFASELARIEGLYRDDRYIRQAVDDEVRTFWKRRGRRLGFSDDYRFVEFARHSTRYLIEECAAFSLMFRRERAVDVYPGSTMLPCVLFKDDDELGGPAFTRIDFSRRNDERAPGPSGSKELVR